jgi:hypothetical protein
VVAVTPPSEAPIVVLPTDAGLASPLELMVATVVLLELQVTCEVTSPMLPSENVAVAVNCSVWPSDNDIEGFDGVMVIALIVLVLTVTVAVEVMLLLDLAVIVAVPRATPVASPEPLTVATPVEDDVQVTCEVTSPVLLLPKVAVAVNCCVPPGVMYPLAGDSDSETMVVAEGKKPEQLANRNVRQRVAAVLEHSARSRLNIIRCSKRRKTHSLP